MGLRWVCPQDLRLPEGTHSASSDLLILPFLLLLERESDSEGPHKTGDQFRDRYPASVLDGSLWIPDFKIAAQQHDLLVCRCHLMWVTVTLSLS